MPDFKRQKFRFASRGVDLNIQKDANQPEKYAKLENVRVNTEGVLEGRGGYSKINSTVISGSPSVHSGWRLNDKLAALFTRIIGAGTALYRGTTSFSSVDTGYSGNPLSLVAYRPDQAAVPYIYVADSSKMAKIDRTNAVENMGIAPPILTPVVLHDRPATVLVDDGSSNTGWAVGGTGTSVGQVTRRHKDGSSIITLDSLLIDRDGGSSGSAPRWAMLGLSTGQLGDDIRPGMRLTIKGNGGTPTRETVVVEEVHAAITKVNRAARVEFDSVSANTGWATCTLSHSSTGVEWDSNIRINTLIKLDDTSTNETVRVEGIVTGPGGERCIRVFFTGTMTSFAVLGRTITLTSFDALRCYITSGSLVAGGGSPDELTQVQRRLVTKTGKGYVEKVLSLDLSRTSIGAARTVERDDLMHISLRVDDNSKIVEGRLEIDVAHTSVSGGTFTGTQFQRNYYFKAFRGDDLVPALLYTQTITTTSSTQVQRRLLEDEIEILFIEEFGNISDLDQQEQEELRAEFEANLFTGNTQEFTATTSDQIEKGEVQWTELSFRIGELTRVGSDKSRGLDTVEGLRFTIVAIDAAGGSEINVDFGSWYIRGGFGPDTSNAAVPYRYRMRARSSVTGAVSNPGPPTREVMQPFRDKIILSPGVAHSDAQVDTIDFFRFGGQIASRGFWYYIGSTDNSASSTLDDVYNDLELLPRELLDFDHDQPFTTVDVAASGTCELIGSFVRKTTGDNFSTSWAPGTVITIDGEPYTLYNQPEGTLQLTIVECGIRGTTLDWQIEEPILLAQPLPYMWSDPLLGIFFVVGDTRRPGYLYWTRGNQPDSAPGFYNQEVTNPSEPLMNGFNYGARSFVFSSEKIHAIWSANVGLQYWRIFETHTKRGLWAPWAFAVGPKVWYLSKDGIYEFDGQKSISITNDDLYPIFPHGELPGVAANGYAPIDMTATAFLRMTYHNSFLFFYYKDTSASFRCLVYDIYRAIWLPDKYADDIRHAFSEVGEGQDTLSLCGNTGFVYDMNGSSADVSTAIAGLIETAGVSGDDPQEFMLVGDVDVQIDRDGETVTAKVLQDLGTVTTVTKVISSGSGIFHTIIDIASGLGVQVRDVALRLTWSATTGKPKAHFWSFTLRNKPLERERRATDWHRINPKKEMEAYVRGIKIKADTSNVAKPISIYADQSDTGNNITLTSDGEEWLTFGWPAFKANEGRLVPDSAVVWQLFDWEWLYEDEPSLEEDLDTNWRVAVDGCKVGYVTGVRITIDSINVLKTLILASEFEGTVTNNISRENTSSLNKLTHNGRLTISFTFEPFRAEQLRIYSTDGVASKLYDFCWIVHPEPPVLGNWDSTFEDFGKFVMITGVAIYADTLGNTKTVQVQLDGTTHESLTIAQGRREVIYPLARTGSPAEFPKAGTARLFPTDIEDAFFYRARWIVQDEPNLIANWDSAWKKISQGGQDAILRGVEIDGDTLGVAKTVQVVMDQAVVATLTVNFDGRQSDNFPIARDSNGEYPRGKVVRLIPTDSNPGQLYSWEPIADLEPAGIANWNSRWEDGGYKGAKFFQGLKLAADTKNVAKTFNVESDGGTVRTPSPLSVTHRVKKTAPFSFATPFIAHNVRVIPTDANDGWLYGVDWVWEPAPEEANLWKTQETTFDIPGYMHIPDGFVTLSSLLGATVTFTLTTPADAIVRTIVVPSGDGVAKYYLAFKANKFLTCNFTLSGTNPFRVYVRDTELKVKAWNDPEAYKLVRPFGGMSRKDGATI